jgi:phosphate starvation-inducible membrane PsiE
MSRHVLIFSLFSCSFEIGRFQSGGGENSLIFFLYLSFHVLVVLKIKSEMSMDKEIAVFYQNTEKLTQHA